jgi:hypothetical protein
LPDPRREAMVAPMGFFDLFGKKGVEKHGPRANDKRAQAPDRWESIQALGKIATSGSPEERSAAITALLSRFTFYVDPSITDGEEKDEAFRWICEAGGVAVDPIKKAMRKHESPSWSLKCLEAVVPDARFLDEMIDVLGAMDTEYARDPQRKITLLSTVEEKRDPKIAAAVARFFSDVNETARFHAVGAALAQENFETVLPQLVLMLTEEDSVRVKQRALEGLSQRELSLGDQKEKIALPQGWHADTKGVPRKTAPKKK